MEFKMTLAVTRIWVVGWGIGSRIREGGSSEFGRACLGKYPQPDGNVQRPVSQISFSSLSNAFVLIALGP